MRRSGVFLGGFACAALLIVFARRPDAFTNPQFWAEDGAVWFAQAYESGPWKPLLRPEAGYLQTISRLGAALAMLVPLRLAPAVTNAIAVALQVLPALIVVSPRFEELVPRLPHRVLLAVIYLCLPSSWETHANLTNAQWHGAVVLGLLLVMPPAHSAAGRSWDAALALVASLSGPCVLFAAPVALLRMWRRRESAFAPVAGAMAVGAAIQGLVVFASTGARNFGPLGASVHSLLGILGGQVVVASLLGQNYLESILRTRWAVAVLAVASSLALAVGFTVIRWGSSALRSFGLYALFIFAGGLLYPNGNGTEPAWPFLARPGNNGRYWLIPMLAFLTALACLAVSGAPRAVRLGSAAVLALYPFGVYRDFRHHPFEDLSWGAVAAGVDRAEPGTRIPIRINPPWETMTLVKR